MSLRALLVVLALPAFGADDLTVGGDFRGALLQHLTGLAEQSWSARARKVAALSTAAEVRERQEFVRDWLLRSIGGFPRKTPLNARVTGAVERDGYRIEKVVFESLPKFFVTANLYLPAERKGPLPAVLGVAGHSDVGKAAATYQAAWIGLVRRGFAVLALDPPGQGERVEYLDLSTGKSAVGVGVPEHIASGLQCLLTGGNIARYAIWDGIRAFDYLLTRPEIDPKRIAVAGNSGGGTQAAYLAVLEPRLACAVTSCYITSWETLWKGPGPQDSEQVFPNFLRDGLDFGDFLIPFAPRPIQMTTAVRDFFPIAGARATYAEVSKAFATADAPGRAGYFEFDDQHGWTKPRREAAYSWLARWLQEREDDTPEADFSLEQAETLRATPTGQVATSFAGAATVRSLNREEAAAMYATRTAANLDPARIRELIASRLGVTRPRAGAASEKVGEVVRQGYRIEKRRIPVADGLAIPALLFVPAAKTPSGAVLWLDSDGKAAAEAEIEKIVLAGEMVLAIDPRGLGESASSPAGRGYTPEYHMAMRGLLVGRTMLGMQVSDTLQAFGLLRSMPGLRQDRIRLAGRGNAGLVALLAAALEPLVAATLVAGSPVSWMDMVRADRHTGIESLVVPGILRDFDTGDAAACIAPRALTLRALRMAGGAPASGDQIRADYGRAIEAYRRAKVPEKLLIEFH